MELELDDIDPRVRRRRVEEGIFNHLFATATPLFTLFDDGKGLPPLRTLAYQPFLVKNIFTDFKRHDLGANFYERNRSPG